MGFVKVRAMCIWVMVVQFTDQTSSDLQSERPHRIFFFKSGFVFRSAYNVAQRRLRRASTRYD